MPLRTKKARVSRVVRLSVCCVACALPHLNLQRLFGAAAIRLQPHATSQNSEVTDEEALAALDELDVDDGPEDDMFEGYYYAPDADAEAYLDEDSAEALMELFGGEVDEEVMQALFGTGGDAELASLLESLGLDLGDAADAYGDDGGTVKLVDEDDVENSLADDEEEFADSEL